MARWADPFNDEALNRMRPLLLELGCVKPVDWSVVWGDREIVVRPSDRSLGKYSITYSNDRGFCVGFYSKARGQWLDRQTFSAETAGSVAEILNWMKSCALRQQKINQGKIAKNKKEAKTEEEEKERGRKGKKKGKKRGRD
jgi:hypothetical protein